MTISKLAVGCTSNNEAIASLLPNFSHHVGQRHVAQTVSVVRQEHVFAFKVRFHRLQPLADGGVGPVSTKVIVQSSMSRFIKCMFLPPCDQTKSLETDSS